jgi:hypothetical protein
MRRWALGALALALCAGVHAQTACVNGASGIAPAATLIFVPPTANTDGSALNLPLTYNLYQSTVSGAEVKVASGLKGSPISVVTGLTPRTTYYFKVSVTDAAGNESALSVEACKAFPGSVPGAVTITVT